ncbi:MAG: hypothetical protein KDA96_10660, partial [Planctomycetaceae bacterium]|nr:hypothetical protein [Planctomycetaceae bacterium]
MIHQSLPLLLCLLTLTSITVAQEGQPIPGPSGTSEQDAADWRPLFNGRETLMGTVHLLSVGAQNPPREGAFKTSHLSEGRDLHAPLSNSLLRESVHVERTQNGYHRFNRQSDPVGLFGSSDCCR